MLKNLKFLGDDGLMREECVASLKCVRCSNRLNQLSLRRNQVKFEVNQVEVSQPRRLQIPFQYNKCSCRLPFLCLLGPSVLQCNGAVEHQLAGGAVFIQSKIGEALELVAQLWLRVFQAWLAFRRHYFERVRVEH